MLLPIPSHWAAALEIPVHKSPAGASMRTWSTRSEAVVELLGRSPNALPASCTSCSWSMAPAPATTCKQCHPLAFPSLEQLIQNSIKVYQLTTGRMLHPQRHFSLQAWQLARGAHHRPGLQIACARVTHHAGGGVVGGNVVRQVLTGELLDVGGRAQDGAPQRAVLEGRAVQVIEHHLIWHALNLQARAAHPGD